MATVGDLLRQVPFMQRPMAGARADGGRDELGNPTMRDFLGRGYMADYSGYEVDRLQDYLPEMNPERASTAPRATTRTAPPGMSQPGLSGVAAALMGGVTAPARAARGEDMRMGDVMSTALDFGLGGAAGVAPAGSLRSGAMRGNNADMARIGFIKDADPNSLIFGETMQNNLEAVRGIYPEGGSFDPLVAVDGEDGLTLVDGHNRAAIAKERGQTVPVISIPQSAYARLKDEGYDAMEITHALLEREGYGEAASGLRQKFTGSDLYGPMYDIQDLLDEILD